MAISMESGVPQRIAKITAVPEKRRDRYTIPYMSALPESINWKASSMSLTKSAKTGLL
jgi:hypothetical protein